MQATDTALSSWTGAAADVPTWITTYTGVKFSPFAPRVGDILIEDIAHHLALQNRWLGATVRPYSTAQHCIHVAEIVPPADRLWALLHDASEAYLTDIPRLVKKHPAMAPYRALEDVLQRVIFQRFGLTGDVPPSIKPADNELAVAEAQDLLRAIPDHFPEAIRNRTAKRPEFPINAWAADFAERRFLEMFRTLTARA